MRDFPAFDPQQSLTSSGIIHTFGVNPNEQILVYNDSPCGLLLIFADNSRANLPAFWNEDFTIAQPMGDIAWYIEYTLENPTEYPISRVYGTLYEKEERVASVNTSMNRGIVVTNSGGLVTGTTLTNTGSAPGTNIITIGSTAVPGLPTMNETSDGIMTLATTIAGALVQFLKSQETGSLLLLGANGYTVEVIGSLQVDQNSVIKGTETITGLLTANGGISSSSSANNLSGGTIAASSVAAANVAAGSLGSGVIVTSTPANATNSVNATNATNASVLSEGVNLPGGLGRTAADDVLSLTSTVVTHATGGVGTNVDNTIKAAGTGKVRLNAGGVDDIIADGNNGIYIPNGYIGKSAKGDFVDFSGTGIYMKGGGSGGIFIYQAPGGTTQWQRAKENHGTVVAVSAGTVTVTHGMGRVPDLILVTPNNGTAGSQTFAVWNVTTTTFQIYNNTNTPTYWWKCENYT